MYVHLMCKGGLCMFTWVNFLCMYVLVHKHTTSDLLLPIEECQVPGCTAGAFSAAVGVGASSSAPHQSWSPSRPAADHALAAPRSPFSTAHTHILTKEKETWPNNDVIVCDGTSRQNWPGRPMVYGNNPSNTEPANPQASAHKSPLSPFIWNRTMRVYV